MFLVRNLGWDRVIDWGWFIDLLDLIERVPHTHWDRGDKGVTNSLIVRYFRSGGEWMFAVFQSFIWSGGGGVLPSIHSWFIFLYCFLARKYHPASGEGG